MIVKLLIENHLEFLSLKGGGTGSSESTLVKYFSVNTMLSTLFFLASIDFCHLLIIFANS